jgi:hypothetical protein
LEIFDKSTLILSENSSPTIQLVIQIKRRIISKLKIDDKDSDSIIAFKQILKSNVEKYMKTHLIHNLALFFDPKCKDLKLLNETEKEEVMNVLVENMKSLSIKNQPKSKTQITIANEPPEKKHKKTLSESFLYDSDDEQEVAETGDEYEKEVELYSKAVFTGTSDLLKFWFEYSTLYPNIANVAKKVLALPATQFESERNFSCSGRTLESRRCRLSPENVDYLLFIKSNHKF